MWNSYNILTFTILRHFRTVPTGTVRILWFFLVLRNFWVGTVKKPPCSFGFDFSIILHVYTGWQTTLVEQDHVQFKTRMTMQRCMPGRGRSYHKWRGK